MLAIVALCVVGVSAAHVWLTARLLRTTVDQQMRSVATTLDASTYPLEANVLRQVRGLSGAELVIIDPSTGEALAASNDEFRAAAASSQLPTVQAPRELDLRSLTSVDGTPYFVAAARLDRRAMGGAQRQLVLFYPERTFRDARWQAIFPSLVVGGVALAFAVALSTIVAARVTEPVQRLKQQTERIASGDFTPADPPQRDDELRDLALAVNRMATLMSQSAQELRQHERARTLHQIGAGIAHQLRNAATGCRMALDLFRRQEDRWRNDENLTVAARQLELMEAYLQRFLVLGRTTQQERAIVDLGAIIASAVELVRPMANHLRVAVEAAPLPRAMIEADRTSLEQAIVNLLTNGIEACASPGTSQPRVEVNLSTHDGQHRLRVVDNGPGLANAVTSRLGEPFVTSKPEGTGLGLAVAREIVVQHGGQLTWQREGARTVFEIALPVPP